MRSEDHRTISAPTWLTSSRRLRFVKKAGPFEMTAAQEQPTLSMRMALEPLNVPLAIIRGIPATPFKRWYICASCSILRDLPGSSTFNTSLRDDSRWVTSRMIPAKFNWEPSFTRAKRNTNRIPPSQWLCRLCMKASSAERKGQARLDIEQASRCLFCKFWPW